ncbi:MAG: hypothetical protein ACLT1W_15810, partial [Alistipes onderdonkii]
LIEEGGPDYPVRLRFFMSWRLPAAFRVRSPEGGRFVSAGGASFVFLRFFASFRENVYFYLRI